MQQGTSSLQQEQAADQAAREHVHAGALDRVLSHPATYKELASPT
jgi:hypothetical protein